MSCRCCHSPWRRATPDTTSPSSRAPAPRRDCHCRAPARRRRSARPGDGVRPRPRASRTHRPLLALVTWTRAFAGILAESMAAGLLDVARSWRPDLVVHEDSEQGSWIAAERLGVPHIALQATAWRGNLMRASRAARPSQGAKRAAHRTATLSGGTRPGSSRRVLRRCGIRTTPCRPRADRSAPTRPTRSWRRRPPGWGSAIRRSGGWLSPSGRRCGSRRDPRVVVRDTSPASPPRSW